MNTKQKTPILLIDNESHDVNKIKSYLSDAGIKYDLHHVETLFEGLNYIGSHQIELVLLEINLPDSQGFKTVNS